MTQIQIPLRNNKKRFKNKILKKKNSDKKIKEKPIVNKLQEDFSRIIQEEYDPEMMKNIEYIDDFYIYENDASITDSVLEKHYYNEKNLLEAKDKEEINNIQPVREYFRKRKDKKMRKSKIRERYQITQRNNNLIINIDMTNTPEKRETEHEKKLCHICKKFSSNYNHIVSYDDFITFFKNISDQKDNENPDFLDNREKIMEINNAFESMDNTTTNIDLTLCIGCPKSILNQKNGFSKILEMIQESLRVKKKSEKIKYEKINFINDKHIEDSTPNCATTVEEMRNCIRLLESFTKFQKMLVFRIFSQCDDYVTQTVNYLASFDVTVANLINLNNFYSFMNKDDGANFSVLKNILLYKSNLITLFCLNVGVLKNQFNHFVSKYENGEDPTKIRPENMLGMDQLNSNFFNLIKNEENETK